MKKILTLILLFASYWASAQLSSAKINRIQSASTAFGFNIPMGDILYDATTKKWYGVALARTSGETIGGLTLGTHIKDMTGTTTNTANALVLRDGSGYVSLTGTFCTSDSTLKRNIRKLSSTDLYNASKIDFRKFLFKKDTTDHQHYGVVYQQVKELIPAVTSISKDTGKGEVNYTELLILLVAQQKEAIRELEKRIEKLENKNRWEDGQVDFSLVQNKDLCPKCKKGHLKPTGRIFSTKPDMDAFECDNCNYTTEK